jgi:hypothetical protein
MNRQADHILLAVLLAATRGHRFARGRRGARELTSSTSAGMVSAFGYDGAVGACPSGSLAGAVWEYGYDALGQVTSGRKFWPDGTPVAGQQFEYAFDDIGNRKSAGRGGDGDGRNLRYKNYQAILLNQFTQCSVAAWPPASFSCVQALCLRRFFDEVIDIPVDRLAQAPAGALIGIDHYMPREVCRVTPDATAFSLRQPGTIHLRIITAWDDPDTGHRSHGLAEVNRALTPSDPMNGSMPTTRRTKAKAGLTQFLPATIRA